jgi:hypothetical protein
MPKTINSIGKMKLNKREMGKVQIAILVLIEIKEVVNCLEIDSEKV